MIRSAKILLLGDIAVGKTSIAKRLVFDRFDSDYKTTIGVNVLSHEVTVYDGGANKMRLVIWDTDGDFSQAIFNTTYVVGAAGAIVVADTTRPATISRMADLIEGFEERFPGRPVAAVLNKVDLAEPPALDALRPSLRTREFTRTSALTGEGVGELFNAMAIAIRRRDL